MSSLSHRWLISAAALVICISGVAAEQPTDESNDQAMRFFENRIRPLLVKRCYECHATDNVEGGLRLDAGDAISKGGDSGPVVVPGKPEESLLVSAIRYEELEMPPDEPLSAEEQADIVRWVRQGAYWPTVSTSSDGDDDVAPPWWAAQPIDPGQVPEPIAGTSSRHVIDRYIDAKLDQAGLRRAKRADRARLVRRLYYDLVGLPPSPEVIDRFADDESPNAYDRLVDRLLADPAYGERMARLWLDLVRYADSDGWRADAYRPQAWRFRQFVVDAFNSGMPYDEFVRLHLAGDEIDPANEEALAAVGFLRLGIYEYNQRDAEGQWQNIVDEMTDVTADVFLATGMACAKCHDHKFDPIPRADYFRMRSVFEPVSFVDWSRKSPPSAADQQTIGQLLAELAEVEGDAVRKLGEAVINKFPLKLQAMYRKPLDQRNTYEHQMAYLVGRQYLDEGLAGNKLQSKIGKEANERRKQILAELDKYGANPYSPADLMTVADAPGQIRPTRLPGRTKGSSFAPGSPGVFGRLEFNVEPPFGAPASSGRRLALANWIVSPENPITARVMVNRLWQYHFGTGLVNSPNDFGQLGTLPSHPKLLDYLAKEFIESGWNIQAIQRRIVTSETYKQSSLNDDAATAAEIDAGNRLLWHKRVRRLDAEQFRDSLLVATGGLFDQIGGPTVSGTPARRSIYLRRLRNSADEILVALDTPPGIVGTAKRDVTTTAPQSLMMMNSPRIISTAKSFAKRVRSEVDQVPKPDRDQAFVQRAHKIIAGIEAAPELVDLLVPMAAAGEQGQVDLCHVLLNSNAFLFIE